MATWLDSNIHFATAIDFGCGNGMLINELDKLSKRVLGIDISTDALELTPLDVRDFIIYRDITRPLFFGKFDLVISLETAEHLPPNGSNQLIENLIYHSTGVICFSAAVPGQGGTGHINERPPEFWLSLFGKHRYYLDEKLTDEFRGFLTRNGCKWWYSYNVQILKNHE